MSPRLLLQLSWRNLWRRKRRNGLLLAAISFAIAGVVVLNALIRGMQVQMADTAVNNMNGHVKVLAPGYRDDPGIAKSFDLAKEWRPEALEGVEAEMVLGWATRVRVPAVVMSERETRGVQLVGIDPAAEDISFIGDVPVAGERLSGPEDGRLLVGRALAEQLETRAGRRIVLITQGADGRNREAGYRIAGLYDAEGESLEKAFLFTGIANVQNLLDTSVITELSVRLTEGQHGPSVLSRMIDALTGLDVLTWQDLEPAAAAVHEFVDIGIAIWFLIIMGALAFGLINTLVTAVMERTRELGMLRAVGMRPRSVVAQVVVESMLIMVLGIVIGLVFGILLYWPMADGIDLSAFAAATEQFGIAALMLPKLEAGDVWLVVSLSIVIGLLASVYPAWRSVKMTPLEAMRR